MITRTENKCPDQYLDDHYFPSDCDIFLGQLISFQNELKV